MKTGTLEIGREIYHVHCDPVGLAHLEFVDWSECHQEVGSRNHY